MKASSRLVVLGLSALLLLFVSPAAAAPEADHGVGSAWWCGTYDLGIEEALARHEWNRRRRARELRARSAGTDLESLAGPSVRREGDVAVIEDDGTIIAPRNLFDYENKGVRFIRKQKTSFKVKRLGGAVSSDLGDKLALGDDDAVRVDLPFKVRFFGKKYGALYVNSDGNLTFGEADTASTARDIQRLLNGPPRIAPFFADLDPQTATGDGGVYFRIAGNKLFVTWWGVPEFGKVSPNTFQAIVYSRGNVDFRFGETAAEEGIVGLAPGAGGGLELVDLSEDLPIKRKGVAIAERFAASETVDEATVAQFFYRAFADDYDQLVMFTEFGGLLRSTIAYHLTIKNDVRGIGVPIYDGSKFFGSKGRLEGFNNMGGMTKYSARLNKIAFLGVYSALDILAHELGHRWLVRATFIDSGGQVSEDLLGRGNAHWSYYFDSDASFLEGNEIRDNGDGTFTTLEKRASYNPLDLYLMGLIPATDVPDKFYVAFANGPDADVAPPEFGVTFVGKRVDVTMADVLASLGSRRPSVRDSPKDFRVGFILLSKKGEKPSAASISKVQEFASEIEKLFKKSTGNLATIDSTLAAN